MEIDIVSRLRGRIGPLLYQHDHGIALTREAADEIERLQAIAHNKQMVEAEREELRYQVERLQEALQRLLNWVPEPYSGDWDTPRGRAIQAARGLIQNASTDPYDEYCQEHGSGGGGEPGGVWRKSHCPRCEAEERGYVEPLEAEQ